MLLQHLFIDNAKKNPHKTAVIEQQTGQEISYDRLLIAALAFRNLFVKIPSKYVGIMLPPSPGCIFALLGVIFANKTPVMINYSTGAIDNCLFAQKKCGFTTIITSKKLLEKLNQKPIKGIIFMEDLATKVNIFQKLRAKVLSKFSAEYLKDYIGGGNTNDNVVVLFTSGSEKDPRAVQLSHKNILHNINAVVEALNINHTDVFMTNLPYFHVFGLTVNFWIPLIVGAHLVTTLNPLDYKVIVETARRYQITVLVSTPTFLYGYLQKSQKGDFASARYFVAGADKLPSQLREDYMRVHGINILEGYGTTETSPIIAVNTHEHNRIGSVGKPLPGVKVKIVDYETGEELPRGEEGKIIVKGDLVMKGYLGNIEETYFRIRDGWYDTGDMGYLDQDGFLFHRGRLKRFVKIGGEMVSLVRVEEAINDLLPEETICCVVDIPDERKGSEIVAVVTTKQIDHREIKKRLAKILPSIAIPKKFRIIDEFPMSSSGKVNFRAVEDLCRHKDMEEF
jgi:acyl-[acyl-carrier-protein]-phospholipid O-acyltransferase/long-chain-fatty-acid--[acyl-carrier-protein] ligase